MGPNNDVQKYDSITFLEVLPGYVAFHCLTFTDITV